MLTETAVAELRFELSGCIENACMHIHERNYRSVYMYMHACAPAQTVCMYMFFLVDMNVVARLVTALARCQ